MPSPLGAVSGAIVVGGFLSGVPIGVAYLSGMAILGIAFVSVGVWLLGASSANRVAESAA